MVQPARHMVRALLQKSRNCYFWWHLRQDSTRIFYRANGYSLATKLLNLSVACAFKCLTCKIFCYVACTRLFRLCHLCPLQLTSLMMQLRFYQLDTEASSPEIVFTEEILMYMLESAKKIKNMRVSLENSCENQYS